MLKNTLVQSFFLSLHRYSLLVFKGAKVLQLAFCFIHLNIRITKEMHMLMSAGKMLLYGLYLLKFKLLKVLKSLM